MKRGVNMKKVRKVLLSIFLLTGLFAVIGQNVNANYGSFKNVTVSETQLTTLAKEIKKTDTGKTTITDFEAEGRVIICFYVYNSNTNNLIYQWTQWSDVTSKSVTAGAIDGQYYTLKAKLLDSAGSIRVTGKFKP